MMNILIIEDDPMIAEALQDILEVMGHTCHWLPDGNTIGEFIRDRSFPVVILDLELPGKSGLEVASEIYRQYPETSIIFSTGFSEQVENISKLGAGKYQLINKPFDINDIRNAISRITF